MAFPDGLDSKESIGNAGDLCSIPGLGRSLGEGNDYPLQYSCLENLMDRGNWRATVPSVTKSDMTEQLTHTHTHTRSEGMTTVPLRGGDIWITMSGEINDPSSGARCRLGLACRVLSINSHWNWKGTGTQSCSCFISLLNKIPRTAIKVTQLRHQVASSI